MTNYFNKLNLRNKLEQLSKCRLMKSFEFSLGNNILKNKKIVIIGCGAQGLNQGLNMRDSGLNISYVLSNESIAKKNISWHKAKDNGFVVGTYNDLIPTADLVINLTPDKQHHNVIKNLQSLMKFNSILGCSHGFNIVEEGESIRKDITVIMVAPKSPGTELRKEYKNNFGVPTLIAVHYENDDKFLGLEYAKAWAFSIGSHKAGVIESSFIAEVKSDLMGEQTILCGMLQTGSLLCFDKLVSKGLSVNYAGKLVQYGWEVITNSLKCGGITLMMDRLSNPAKIRAYNLSAQLKQLLSPLFQKHMDDILSGNFSSEMKNDWNNNDKKLLHWRNQTSKLSFETAPIFNYEIHEQDFYEQGILMVAIIKAGSELAFETMIKVGIRPESAYYESLHELPLIANIIARKRLHEMNMVISDTAEYGNYLFSLEAIPLLKNFFINLKLYDIGEYCTNVKIDNLELCNINEAIYNHPIELIGRKLRSYMNNMKSITT